MSSPYGSSPISATSPSVISEGRSVSSFGGGDPFTTLLTPTSYPVAKPYGSFTTLLHRYGRYEKVRQSMVLNEPTSPWSDRSQSDDEGLTGRKAFSDTADSEDGSVRGKHTYFPSARSMSRDNAIHTLGDHLARSALSEMNDQRVALTPKQEVKIEMARLKKDVDKLFGVNAKLQTGAQHRSPLAT